MSRSALAKYESLHGHPCPRRVLRPENAGAFRLVQLHMSEMHGFVEAALDALCFTDQEKWDITGRVLRAVSDREVQDVMYPPKRDGEK